MRKTTNTVAAAAAVAILGTVRAAWGQSTYTRTATGTSLSGDTTAWSPAGVPGSLDIAAWGSASLRTAAGNVVNADIAWAGVTVTGSSDLKIGNGGTATVLSIGAGGIDMSTVTANVTLNNKVAFTADQTWTVAVGRALFAAPYGIGTGNGNITLAKSGTGTATVHVKPPNATANGLTGNWRVGSNVELQFYRNAFFALGSGTVTLENGSTLTQSDGNWELRNNLILGTADDDTVTIGSRSSATGTRRFKLTGVLSGPGNIVFPNLVPGSMTSINNSGYCLTDTNTFTGSMTINPGTIVRIGGVDNTDTTSWGATNSGSIHSSAAVVNNGSLVFARSDAYTFPNTITGTGAAYIGGDVGALIAGAGTQSLTLSGNNSFAGGTVISAGQLTIPAVSALGTGPVTLGSGTLVYTGAGEATARTLTINSSAVTLSVTQPSASLAWSDSATKTQSITKDGAGKLLLGGPLTGSGSLTIRAGTLSLTNANNTRSSAVMATVSPGAAFALPDNGSWLGQIAVFSNATFDVSERASPFALGSGQELTLYSGSSVTGTPNVATGSVLTFGGAPQTQTIGGAAFRSDLVLSGGTVYFDLASSPAGVSDNARIVGALKLSQSSKTTVSVTAAAGVLSAGRYPLFFASAICDAETGGDLNLTAENYDGYLILTGTPGTTQTFALMTGDGTDGTVAGTLYLAVTGDTPALTWNGTSGQADWTTSDAVSNWLADSSASVSYADDYVVRFTDESAVKQVNLPAPVVPGQMRFDNTQAYTLSGSGAISGAAELVKSGTGTVTFANSATNRLTGSIRLNGGELAAESFSKHLGTGAVRFEAASGDSGVLTITAPAETLTRPLDLSGPAATGTLNIASGNLLWAASGGQVAGTLLKRGAGTLGLSGEACAITGCLSIREGTVSLAGGAARTATLDVENGASLFLDAGTTLGHGGLNMTGPISGSGLLTTRNTGHLLLYSDMSGYSGTIIADNSCLALMGTKSAYAGVDIQLGGPQGRIPYLAIGPVFVGSVAEIGSLSGRGDIGVQYDADAGVRTLKINQSVDGLWNGRVAEDANGTRTLALIKDGVATFGIVGDVVQAYALQIAAGDVDIGAGTANGTHYGPIALSAPDTRILWRRSDVTTVTHAAAITGSGSVLIDGAATIVLAGANTYSGGTTVSNGTLLVNGSHTGGTGYTVETGATFGGTGTVTLASGTVKLLAGATLAAGPASGAGGTFTVSSLTLAPDAGVTFDAIDDAIVVTGTLALNDNRVTPTHIGSLDKNKRYPILTCQGTVNGSLASRIADTSWIVFRDGNTFFLQYNAGTVISFR